MKHFILTGETGIGKSEAIMRFRKSIGQEKRGSDVMLLGVAAPLTKSRKFLFSLSSGEEREWEIYSAEFDFANDSWEANVEELERKKKELTAQIGSQVLRFGRCLFDSRVIPWMEKVVISDLDHVIGNPGAHKYFFFFDELGPLELYRGEGFLSAYEIAFAGLSDVPSADVTMISVVRPLLVEDFLHRFGLEGAEVAILTHRDLVERLLAELK